MRGFQCRLPKKRLSLLLLSAVMVDFDFFDSVNRQAKACCSTVPDTTCVSVPTGIVSTSVAYYNETSIAVDPREALSDCQVLFYRILEGVVTIWKA